MKKLLLLILLVTLSFTSFSQNVTDSTSIQLEVPVAKLVIKDLISGDGAKEELKINSEKYLESFACSADDGERTGLTDFRLNIGNINTNGSQSFFSGGSDYRLKQDVENITDAITKIKSLRPVKFRWKNNLGVGYDSGFIAHEIQETGHFDHLVSGVKDGMRKKSDDPNQQEPDYQGVDYGKFTPMLVAALKEISDKVDALDTRLTSLENT